MRYKNPIKAILVRGKIITFLIKLVVSETLLELYTHSIMTLILYRICFLYVKANSGKSSRNKRGNKDRANRYANELILYGCSNVILFVFN